MALTVTSCDPYNSTLMVLPQISFTNSTMQATCRPSPVIPQGTEGAVERLGEGLRALERQLGSLAAGLEQQVGPGGG